MSVAQADYRFALVTEAPTMRLPADKRISFGLEAFPVLPDGSLTKLQWSDQPVALESRLRVMVALDVREEVRVDVLLLENQQIIGTLDIRYAYVCQLFEIMLDAQQTAAALQGGLGLRTTQGTQALWFYNADVADTVLYRPHLALVSESQPLEQFYQRLTSLDSLQPFGWMEGCVLDALLDLRTGPWAKRSQTALMQHLKQFVDDDNRLFYEDPRSHPADNRIYGIEGTLPFAAFAELWPGHPVLDQVVAFWQAHVTEQGAIQDGGTLSAEGAYTIAYPLAMIARQRGDADMLDLALRQLILRRDYLKHDDGLYLRYHQDGQRTFRNWARGCAWYILGMVRTLQQIDADRFPAELCDELQRTADWISAYARPDGLWFCFIDEPNVLADTSGSAGIAAALALGVQGGLLDGAYRDLAVRTFETLQTYLTPDGFLTGVAQANRGGEALQRGDYRVISQMGMGLMGQLGAALEA